MSLPSGVKGMPPRVLPARLSVLHAPTPRPVRQLDPLRMYHGSGQSTDMDVTLAAHKSELDVNPFATIPLAFTDALGGVNAQTFHRGELVWQLRQTKQTSPCSAVPLCGLSALIKHFESRGGRASKEDQVLEFVGVFLNNRKVVGGDTRLFASPRSVGVFTVEGFADVLPYWGRNVYAHHALYIFILRTHGGEYRVHPWSSRERSIGLARDSFADALASSGAGDQYLSVLQDGEWAQDQDQYFEWDDELVNGARDPDRTLDINERNEDILALLKTSGLAEDYSGLKFKESRTWANVRVSVTVILYEDSNTHTMYVAKNGARYALYRYTESAQARFGFVTKAREEEEEPDLDMKRQLSAFNAYDGLTFKERVEFNGGDYSSVLLYEKAGQLYFAREGGKEKQGVTTKIFPSFFQLYRYTESVRTKFDFKTPVPKNKQSSNAEPTLAEAIAPEHRDEDEMHGDGDMSVAVSPKESAGGEPADTTRLAAALASAANLEKAKETEKQREESPRLEEGTGAMPATVDVAEEEAEKGAMQAAEEEHTYKAREAHVKLLEEEGITRRTKENDRLVDERMRLEKEAARPKTAGASDNFTVEERRSGLLFFGTVPEALKTPPPSAAAVVPKALETPPLSAAAALEEFFRSPRAPRRADLRADRQMTAPRASPPKPTHEPPPSRPLPRGPPPAPSPGPALRRNMPYLEGAPSAATSSSSDSDSEGGGSLNPFQDSPREQIKSQIMYALRVGIVHFDRQNQNANGNASGVATGDLRTLFGRTKETITVTIDSTKTEYNAFDGVEKGSPAYVQYVKRMVREED